MSDEVMIFVGKVILYVMIVVGGGIGVATGLLLWYTNRMRRKYLRDCNERHDQFAKRREKIEKAATEPTRN